MEMIDYMEREAARLLDRAQHDFQRAHDLSYRLATLMLGGGGALGSYLLARGADDVRSPLWWALVAVMLWWFVAARRLIAKGMRSRHLSHAGRPLQMGERYVQAFADRHQGGLQPDMFTAPAARKPRQSTKRKAI